MNLRAVGESMRRVVSPIKINLNTKSHEPPSAPKIA